MFGFSKRVDEMDEALKAAFEVVGSEINTVVRNNNTLNAKLEKALKRIKELEDDRYRATKVGPITGKTYMTVAGKVNALARNLGYKFEAQPATKTPASVSLVKVKKGKK